VIALAHHDGSGLFVSNPAPALGEQVWLRVRTRSAQQPDSVTLRTVIDGEPLVTPAEVVQVDGPVTWWQAPLTVRNPVSRYRWLLSGGPFGYAWLNAAGIVDVDVPDANDFVLSAFPMAPAWVAGSVVYQVFPDRFARSSADDPLAALTGKAGESLPSWAIPRGWDEHPQGRGPATPFEFFGGDLDGLAQRLDHLCELGANVLYLTPFFPAGSTHRYDAGTFESVDPLLGGDRALAELTTQAHRLGLRVLGDITLNHCGATHEWFVRARAGSEPERGFFRFDDALANGYESWLGVPSLPKFDFTSPVLLEQLVTGSASALRRWLAEPYRLDGWRVDVANMAGRLGPLDLTHELAREVRRVVVDERPDGYLVAEHGHDASGDLAGDGWHGTMNYSGFTRQVWCWLKGPQFQEEFLGLPVPAPTISTDQFVRSLRAFHGRIPWRSLIASWNILSSHDSARIRTVVGSAERQVAAFALSVGLPGVPMIFAGDEIGAQGHWGEDSRTPFPWHDRQSWDVSTLQAYRALIAIRRSSPALAEGGLEWVAVAEDAVAFVRDHPRERLLIVVARDRGPGLRIPAQALDGARCEHLFGFPAHERAEGLEVELAGAGAGIWRLVPRAQG